MRLKSLILAAALTLGMASTAFAGTWKLGVTRPGEYWYDFGDGSYPANQWAWIDGNYDGVAECYYFDSSGWMIHSQQAPDGFVTNETGAWTLLGVVQQKAVTPGSVTICK